MKRILRIYTIISLFLLPYMQARACVCQYLCGFMEQVHNMFAAYPPGTFNWEEQVVIIKAAYVDSIPNSFGGSRVKLLTQFYGRPVKDTFNFLPGGTDCDLYLRDFHNRRQDTLFLILHRNVISNSWLGDTVKYSLTMCGRHFAVVRNDSVIENCSTATLTASAMADSLRSMMHMVVNVTGPTPASTYKVYPNPATDKLIIEGMSKGKVALLSLIGQQVAGSTITASGQVLNLSGLPAGAYILLLTAEDGSSTAMRIMKE